MESLDCRTLSCERTLSSANWVHLRKTSSNLPSRGVSRRACKVFIGRTLQHVTTRSDAEPGLTSLTTLNQGLSKGFGAGLGQNLVQACLNHHCQTSSFCFPPKGAGVWSFEHASPAQKSGCVRMCFAEVVAGRQNLDDFRGFSMRRADPGNAKGARRERAPRRGGSGCESLCLLRFLRWPL